METIAMLGLGAMGRRMAGRLIEAGYPVVVWNRTASRADALVATGATRAETPAEAAATADIVVSMVTDDAAADAVWLHPETGALRGLRPGALAIEASTVTPGWITTLAAAVAERDATLLDAPVAGSRPQAEAGKLVWLVGGTEADLLRARPALDAMGGAVHHCGARGAGATMKLAVNAWFAVQVSAMGELMGLLRRAGFEDARSAEILGALPVTAPGLAGVARLIAAGTFAPMFPIDLVAKDLRYATGLGSEVGAALPATTAALGTYGQAREAGHGGDNIHGVAQLFG